MPEMTLLSQAGKLTRGWKPGTVPNYPIAESFAAAWFGGRPGGRGRRSRPSARPMRSTNAALPSGQPRRVASRIRSSNASSSTPMRRASRQRSPLEKALPLPQVESPVQRVFQAVRRRRRP